MNTKHNLPQVDPVKVYVVIFSLILTAFLIVYTPVLKGSGNKLMYDELISLRTTTLKMARAGVNKVPHSEKFGRVPEEVYMRIAPSDLEYLGEWEGTAYNPVTGQTDDDPWITASGRRSVPGVSVAIDPAYWLDLLKEGAFLYIEGYGVVRVDDTGSMVKGRERFDLMVANYDVAMQLGRWKAKVWLIKEIE